MIKLWDTYERCPRYVRHDEIVEILDKGTHHGASTYVRLRDGKTFFCNERVDQILKQIQSHQAAERNQ